MNDEIAKDIGALLSRIQDSPLHSTMTCGHLYAKSVMIGGCYPAVAIYPHVVSCREPPRVVDMNTALHFERLLGDEYDYQVVNVKEFGGTLADWQVVREGRQ